MYKRYTLQDTLDSEKRNLFNVLSTFAGGGGSSTGYRLAGGKILAINEFVPEAQILIERTIQIRLLYQAILKS